MEAINKVVNIAEIKPNDQNPRYISDGKFKKLVKSLKDFPEMLEARPLVVDENMIVLGGNMRLKALQSSGVFNVPVHQVFGWTEKQKREFIIKDNVGFGEWDWDILANEWDSDQLADWGLEVWQQAEDPDYSILDDDDISSQLNDMTNGVKKAIQIEFELEHYEEASALVKYWRDQGAYIGAMIMEHLKSEKNKI